jgi:nitrite reductase/ring-hydroxylating ferredoxin subunit
MQTPSNPIPGSRASIVKHDVLGADELQPGEARAVRVEGIAVVVIRKADGTLSALRDICPHHGARLSIGVVRPLVEADDEKSYVLSDTQTTIRCPWHGFEFDVDSGRCPADPEKYRVRAYGVSVQDGRIYVER